MILPFDILLNEIGTRLDIRTLIKLKITCTELCQTISMEILERCCLLKVLTRLKGVFEDKFDAFMAELDRSGAIVSGSFLIQCILGEEWSSEKRDIDIYVDIKDKLVQVYKCATWNPTTQFETWFFDNFLFTDVTDATQYLKLSSSIVWIREFTFPKPGIAIPDRNFLGTARDSQIDQTKPILQIIDLDFNETSMRRFEEIVPRQNFPKDIFEFIDLTFDFDVCKNTFGVRAGQPELRIKCLNQIVNKISTYSIPIELNREKTESRKRKYVERGFRFI